MMRTTEQALKAIESKGTTLARAVVANSDEIARLITQASVTATTSVGRAVTELEDKAKLAIEKSQRTSTAAVAEMLETHSMLRNDTTALFERLRDANTLLQEVLSGADDEPRPHREHAVCARAGLRRRPGRHQRAQRQRKRPRRGADQVVPHRDRGRADRYQHHGASGSRSRAAPSRRLPPCWTRVIAASRRRLASGKRRWMWPSPTSAARTESLDQRFKRFSTLLQESLVAAEGRAREIARLIANSSTEGTRAIAGQYELVRNDQRGRASAHARGAARLFEETSSETQALFSRASERFNQVVKEMKRVGGHDAARTRDHARGIAPRHLDLPQETVESTAQLRRVIVEQIDALAELNRIVARHGRGMDTVEHAPVRHRCTSRRSRRSRMRPGSACRRARFRGHASRPAAGPAAAAAATAPKRRRRPRRMAERRAHARLARGNAAARSRVAPVRRRGRRAWERSTRSRSTSPAWSIMRRQPSCGTSASVARTRSFTRRLYTAQGQQTFEEIRQASTAQTAISSRPSTGTSAEFERLLDEVSHDDRGSAVALSYLTSETGKVYTMLAHAAGRFD